MNTFRKMEYHLYMFVRAHRVPIFAHNRFIECIVDLDKAFYDILRLKVLPSENFYSKLPQTHFCKGTELGDSTSRLNLQANDTYI